MAASERINVGMEARQFGLTLKARKGLKMSHLLPPANSPLREMFDIADLVAIGTKQREPITFKDAVFASKRFFASQPKGLVKSVVYIALKADGSLVLVSFGPRGAHKIHWIFRHGDC